MENVWNKERERQYGGQLTHKHFEPIVLDKVLMFDDAILIAAKIKTLPFSVNQEETHTATLEG